MLSFAALVLTVSAVFGYINHRWLKLPTAIGVMLISVTLGIGLKIVDSNNLWAISPLRDFLEGLILVPLFLILFCVFYFLPGRYMLTLFNREEHGQQFFLIQRLVY